VGGEAGQANIQVTVGCGGLTGGLGGALLALGGRPEALPVLVIILLIAVTTSDRAGEAPSRASFPSHRCRPPPPAQSGL